MTKDTRAKAPHSNINRLEPRPTFLKWCESNQGIDSPCEALFERLRGVRGVLYLSLSDRIGILTKAVIIGIKPFVGLEPRPTFLKWCESNQGIDSPCEALFERLRGVRGGDYLVNHDLTGILTRAIIRSLDQVRMHQQPA
jgi:hypothetical protein